MCCLCRNRILEYDAQGVEVSRPAFGHGWQCARTHGCLHHLHLPAFGNFKDKNIFLTILSFRWHKVWASLWHMPPSSSQWWGWLTPSEGSVRAGWLTCLKSGGPLNSQLDLPDWSWIWNILNLYFLQRPGDHDHCHWHLLHLPHPDAPHPLLPHPCRPEVNFQNNSSHSLLVLLSGVFGFVISALPTVTSRLLVDLVGIQHLNSSFGVGLSFLYFLMVYRLVLFEVLSFWCFLTGLPFWSG